MLTREQVAMAYRLILGREPENESVVDDHQRRFHDLTSLREAFINSDEFRSQRVAPRFLPADLGPPLAIDLELTPALLQRMFRRVEDCWQALGKTEPYWSVLSSDQFRSANLPSHAAEFDSTGKPDVDRLLAWLVRNHIDPKAIASCTEYGCGVGRVTAWLASHFPHVCGYDISAPHLELARRHLSQKGIRNVALLKLDSVMSVSALEPADLVFTILALQHNPPPVMSHVLRMLLRSLKSGGVAYFQLPTYAVGYHFDVASYFSSSPSPGASLEMHVLPQSTVFEIAEDEGCRVLEVQPDNCVGAAHWISNTFLVSKITPKSPNVNEIQTNQVVSPPLPLPPGFTPEALKAWLTDIRLDGAPPAEMAGYCAQDWKRFVYTWGLATECRGTALELGANPYFTTCLLVEFTKLNLSLANYFGPDHNGVSQSVEYRKWGTNEFVRREFGYSHFNVEADVFPFPNESFDVVLWCEVLEHLQRDPLAALREINRVLKPGGKVILTTPNACRLESVARMISGTNVQDAYSGYGAYGRHNREYTRDELSRLLAWAGFTAEVMFTADVYANPATFFGVDMDKLLPMLDGRKPDLGQYIFSRSTKTQPPRAGRPSFLFRSWPPGEIVDE